MNGNTASTPNNSTSTSNSMDDDLERVFELVVSRSRGQAQTQDVENAISKLLHKKQEDECEITQDLDDYDNLEQEQQEEAAKPVAKKRKTTSDDDEDYQEATLESMRQEEEDNNNNNDTLLETIPLGKSGGRMMVTFGDGHHPKPEAVQAALLGARKCLQTSIKDARALRRHEKEEYSKARKVAILSQSKQGKLKGGAKFQPQQESASGEMMYRAMQGWDKLAYDPKCGFDVEQLRQLFPEEMQAYTKWSEMHNSYKASSEETTTGDADVAPEEGANTKNNVNNGEVDSKTKAAAPSDVPVAEGHLEERAAQFDVRTDQMENDWYLKFSEVRRGSFLPKKSGMKKANEREWDQKRKQAKPKGRPKAGQWDSMSATSVRFLHWVGFDPRSALPPPNDETTEALAFLAYDFMGRIVEKAIYLRNVANEKGDKKLLLELQDGEQLEAADIEKAINDSTIRPVPLYSSLENDDSSSSMPVAASLYFGPGFEDRLEMEMEELASGSKKRKRLSPEEMEIRKREDALFAKLSEAPPAFDGFADVLNEEAAVKSAKESSATSKAEGGKAKAGSRKKKK